MNFPVNFAARPAEQKRNSDKFNMIGLLRISDEQHFLRALETAHPHTYLVESMGMKNSRGEDGLGWYNAIDLHLALITNGERGLATSVKKPHVIEALARRQPTQDDICGAEKDTAFNAALEKIGYNNLPQIYQEIIGLEECAERHKVATAEYAR